MWSGSAKIDANVLQIGVVATELIRNTKFNKMTKVSNEEQSNNANMLLSVVAHDLFSPPFMELKKKIYQARQKVDETIYASEKFITGLEVVAEKQLPSDIKSHNDLVEELNQMVALKKLKLSDKRYEIRT